MINLNRRIPHSDITRDQDVTESKSSTVVNNYYIKYILNIIILAFL